MKIIFFFGLSFLILNTACKRTDGYAASSGYGTIDINPAAVIVPKSTSIVISVMATPNSGGAAVDVTTSSRCTVDNPIATIGAGGQLANTYSGGSIQRLNLTCVYNGLTKTVPVTIVPAVLTSLVFTKNNLLMGNNQTQTIQVYGNFTDANSYVFALDMTNYITWSSSNASVSSALLGIVSSGTNGSANITATFGAISASTSVTVSSATPSPTATPKGVGLLGKYYDYAGPWASAGDNVFTTLFGQRIDTQVYFNWATGTNNLGQVAYFGIRWTGKIYIPTTGSYTFYTTTDDGLRLWINDVVGSPVIDNWTLHTSTEDSVTLTLTAGTYYDIRMDYFENAGYSQAELRWSGPSITKALIPQVNLFPN
jgi:PA14 domain